MIKANIDINAGNNKCKNDIEISGSINQIILEISLILMRIKDKDNEIFKDILKSIEIIEEEIESDRDVEELQDMFISVYCKTLKDGK